MGDGRSARRRAASRPVLADVHARGESRTWLREGAAAFGRGMLPAHLRTHTTSFVLPASEDSALGLNEAGYASYAEVGRSDRVTSSGRIWWQVTVTFHHLKATQARQAAGTLLEALRPHVPIGVLPVELVLTSRWNARVLAALAAVAVAVLAGILMAFIAGLS